MVSLSVFCDYAVIDNPRDPVATLCLDAAIQHAKDSGISEEDINGDNAKCDLYIYSYAAYLYDTRAFEKGTAMSGEANKMRRELVYKKRGDTT